MWPCILYTWYPTIEIYSLQHKHPFTEAKSRAFQCQWGYLPLPTSPPTPLHSWVLVLCPGEKVGEQNLMEQRQRFVDLAIPPNTAFCHSRRWQLHLLPSWWKPKGQSGSPGEPRGLFPELCPLHDLLVSHVWFARGHAEGQAALPEARGVWPAGLDGHRTPRGSLERGACPAPQISEALPGGPPSLGRGRQLLQGHGDAIWKLCKWDAGIIPKIISGVSSTWDTDALMIIYVVLFDSLLVSRQRTDC